jgi:glycosyltransferase involved in cell wall biosynthesis
MKVLLLTDSDVFAGTERHILDLAVALRAEGCEVEIACPDRGILAERARGADVPVFAVEKGTGLDMVAVNRVRAGLRSGRIDLIHSHNGRTAFIAGLAVALAGRGRTVTTQHFVQPARTQRRGLRAWLARRLHGWLAERTGRIIAISEAVRAAILERREAAAEKVTTVWNGINDPTAEPLRPAAEVRAAFQIPRGAPLIVSAARLEPEKAVHLLIDAFAQLMPTHPSLRCLVAGEGRERAVLQAQIDRLGVAGLIRLIGYQPDVLSIIQAADFFVLPSPAEPFGLALVEAMALGKPVIAMRAGGPVEIVTDESGVLVSPNNADELRDAIRRVLDDPAHAHRLGSGARLRFLNCFTAARMARAILGIYREVLAADSVESPSIEQAQVLRESRQ